MSRLVLVADDSPTHQRRASGILTGEGFEVQTVSNGVAAIKKLPTIKPVLILADVSMPGRDGYEVCEFVKSNPELSRVPVLLIYSDLEPYDEARAQRIRADGRIKKPFGQDELLAMVHRFLPEEESAVSLPPPPRPPTAAPKPTVVTEPVDLAPEESEKVPTPDLGVLSEGPVFSEQFLAESAPEIAPPPIPLEEAFSRESATEARPAALPAEPEPAAEPQLVEEPAETVTAPEPETHQRTMMFRMPVEIAEPVLADDQSPRPPVTEAPPLVSPPAPAEPQVAARSVESYSLEETASGQVSLGPPVSEQRPPSPATETPVAAPPAPTVAEAPAKMAAPEQAPAAATTTAGVLDTDLVYWIVHNVVVRMAPPALPSSTVEELIRQINDEMINELTSPPPETSA